jgi:glycosyltransferase involved in cell wall biosynthesis
MKPVNPVARPKLLFVVTEDSYFVSHRLPLALGALQAGMDVAIATRLGSHAELIRQAGITVYSWNVERGSTGIFAELKTLFLLLKIFRQARPDIVHQVAIKPVLYGSLAAKLTGVKKVVNALGGMGFIFSEGSGRKRWLRALVLTGFRWLLRGRNSLLILQNPEDRDLLVSGAAIDHRDIRIIRGAGVDVNVFDVVPEPEGLPLVVLPARMLADKGVHEFVEAAGLLRQQGIKARFALVGGMDECNPACISARQLQEWVDKGEVEWFGRRDDMPAIYASATLVCLPSYREGLPKSLLEAAACGRAIVATDVPGCREIVRDGENGLLVPVRDAKSLAQAVCTLLQAPALRAQMGKRGRAMVLQSFSEEIVVEETLQIYRALLRDDASSAA